MTVGIVDAPQVERLQLDAGSWVDVARGFLADADEVHDALVTDVAWRQGRLYLYDHWVEENRMGAMWRPGDPVPHPALLAVHRWLQSRYRVRFDGFALVHYRDGEDGQGFHRDREMRWCEDTIVAVLTTGVRRPWLLRPRSHRHDHSPSRGATHDLAPATGDLLVMGGRAQADWEHSVAPVRGLAGSRVSVQWRWTSRRGRPEVGGAWNAPRRFGEGRGRRR